MPGTTLIVEDEALIALELEARMSDLGYPVVGVVPSGQQALAAVSRHRPELVLLDINLGASSPDGIRIARQINQTAPACIVFITAHTDADTLQRVREAGPYGFIRKPFDPVMLEITARTALDRWRADRARRVAEGRSLAVLNAATDGILATDVHNTVVLSNLAAERLFGRAIVGTSIAQLFRSDPTSSHPGAALALGQDEPLHVQLSWSEVVDDPEIYRMVQIRDVSRQLELEARTTRAQQMEAVGLLGGGIAHDFGNLLLAMDLNLWLLQEEGASKSFVDQIGVALEQARSLTMQLLALQRPGPAEPMLVEPAVVMRRLEGLAQRLLGDAHVIFDLDPGTPTVLLPRGRLEQIVLNLVMNARQAMPEGGEFTLRTRALHGGALIEVVDDGVGMPPDVLARVFDAFFTTKASGSGLGLTTTRDIVHSSGGRIAIDSEPGRGTRVELWLPSDDGSAAVEMPLPAPLPTRTGSALVVLGEPVTRNAVATTLRKMGATALMAEGTDEAMEIVDTLDTLHLLITDARPGSRLGSALRARHPELRILVLADEQVDVDWGHVLYGPTSRDELVRALSALLPS